MATKPSPTTKPSAETPNAILSWVTARLDPTQSDLLRESLSDDVHFSFAGRNRHGVDAVMEHLAGMPGSGLAGAQWQVIQRGPVNYTVRFTGPGGASLPSPGGPMSSLDFEFTLNDAGKISALSPNPQHTEPADLGEPLHPGSTMPAFALPDVHGETVDWQVGDAKARVILYTANGCPWALGWHDRIQDVVRDYSERGVRFIQINANDGRLSPSDSNERSLARVEAGDFASPYLLDDGQLIARRLGARHSPEIFVVRPDGVIAYHGAPDEDSERPELRAHWLREALDAVLAGVPVTVSETEPIGCTLKWTM